jgi:ATP-dependent Clp protease adaptor protein ClpS
MSDLLIAVDVPTRAQPVEEIETRRQPPYHVILLNDDHHSMQFVVDVLSKVVHCNVERAVQLMFEAHTSGRAVIWTGAREVAELKAQQIQSCHEIHAITRARLGPLGCLVEPAPGA